MKILNLYAGIGGNRKGWGDEHEITAVEYDPEIARAYKTFFPDDEVIVGDALTREYTTVKNYIKRLGLYEVQDAAEICIRKGISHYKIMKYFCGICRNKADEMGV